MNDEIKLPYTKPSSTHSIQFDSKKAINLKPIQQPKTFRSRTMAIDYFPPMDNEHKELIKVTGMTKTTVKPPAT